MEFWREVVIFFFAPRQIFNLVITLGVQPWEINSINVFVHTGDTSLERRAERADAKRASRRQWNRLVEVYRQYKLIKMGLIYRLTAIRRATYRRNKLANSAWRQWHWCGEIISTRRGAGNLLHNFHILLISTHRDGHSRSVIESNLRRDLFYLFSDTNLIFCSKRKP